MKFGFIDEWHKQLLKKWPVGALCRILGVSRSGYGAWRRRQNQPLTSRQREKQQAQARLLLQIRAAHRKGRFYYGSPRVYDELRDQGVRVSRKRIARLMRQEGLVGRSRSRRRVQTTDSRHRYGVANNLLERRFTPQEIGGLNRFWCGDITYLPTREGWLYLATVKDLFSRRIIGWAVDDNMEATLVAVAWQRALQTRGFVSTQGPELYHSDQGSQYAGTLFQELLKRSGTQPSMSGKGRVPPGRTWITP